MTPKKAIIIVLVLVLILALVSFFLFFNPPFKTSDLPDFETSGNQPLTATEMIQQKIDQINEAAVKDPANNPPDKVRQEIIDVINAEVTAIEQNKTPEEKAADLEAQAERDRTINEINNQIKEQINNN